MSTEKKDKVKPPPLRPFSVRLWRKVRWPIFFFAILPLSIASFAIAFQTASFNNTATPQRNGAPLFAINQSTNTVANFTQTTVCTGASGSYVNGGGSTQPSIAWGNVNAGNSYNVFICIENTGPGTYIVPASSILNATAMNGCTTPPCGSLVVPQGGTSMIPNSFLLVEIQWQVRSSIPTGGPTNFPFTLS